MDYNPLVGTHTNFSKDCQPQTTLCEKPANYEEENLTVPRQLMPKRRENLCKSHHHQHSNYLWRATQKTEVLSNINRVKNRGSISRSLIPSFFYLGVFKSSLFCLMILCMNILYSQNRMAFLTHTIPILFSQRFQCKSYEL